MITGVELTRRPANARDPRRQDLGRAATGFGGCGGGLVILQPCPGSFARS